MKTTPAVCALLADGWTVQPVLLHDEEGVDGWEWTDPAGAGHCVIGDHGQPPPLPEPPRASGPPSAETLRYIAFLDALLRSS